jgi:NAD(P)-dependent dehydrogenase (short-subunit alcohol dehydrogenase family)
MAKTQEKENEKRIVITGVTRGLGRAMARELAGMGHRVCGCGRSLVDIERLRSEIGGSHDLQVVDVSQGAQVNDWARRVLEHFGPPDLLLNNAAVINRNAPLWELTEEEFARVIDVNIKGVVNVIRSFVPAMIDAGSGVIVNFSSYWGRSTSPEVAPYCASKWAIEGLTQALSEELKGGLAAVAFNPGIIDTDMLRSCFGASAANYASPKAWARKAIPFLLELNSKDNGKQRTAPS